MTVASSEAALRIAQSRLYGNPRFGIIGVGAVGSALARMLDEAGHHVACIWSRSPGPFGLRGDWVIAESAQQLAGSAEIVFLTVPDAAIAGLASAICWRPGQVVVHCSGALGLDVLQSATDAGAAAVALHPLFSFPASRQTVIAPGTRFGFTGPALLHPYFAGLVASLGGVLLDVPEDGRGIYHAAAIVACNYLVTLSGAATAMLQSIGMEKEAALSALLPMMRGTLDNLALVGLPNALTGPIVRGDLATVERHREALRDGDFAQLYDVLASATVELALSREDLTEPQRAAIEQYKRREQASDQINSRGATGSAGGLPPPARGRGGRYDRRGGNE